MGVQSCMSLIPIEEEDSINAISRIGERRSAIVVEKKKEDEGKERRRNEEVSGDP